MSQKYDRRTMKRAIVTVAAAVALAVGGAVTTAERAAAAPAKACSPGWTHGVIGGEHKCLRGGQFCAKRHERQYRRYGYTCQGRLKRR
jgi:hypothetical protein